MFHSHRQRLIQVFYCGSCTILGLDPEKELPDQLLNLDAQMVEHICNEIMSRDSMVKWADIGEILSHMTALHCFGSYICQIGSRMCSGGTPVFSWTGICQEPSQGNGDLSASAA